MKKHLIILLAAMAWTNSHAALVLNEPFDYPDGSLVLNSGGIWASHSGTLNQMQVTGGKAVVTQSQSEDVNALLTGGPYVTGNLYASFNFTFTGLPTGSGGYLAHFKETGTTQFRCRVYAATNNAAPGFFRIGIANNTNASAGASFIPRDLALNTDYKLVMRYDAAALTPSTLWLNPSSESSVTDRADASDAFTSSAMVSFALRQSLSSGNGMGSLTVDNLKVGTVFSDVASGGSGALNPPLIGNIPDQSIPRNTATPAIPFVVSDGETSAGLLTVAASLSSNPGLVPLANCTFTSDGGSNRTVTIMPATGQQGYSRLTVTVTDGDGNTTSREFLVVVGAPSLAPIANVDTITNVPVLIPLGITDPESDVLTLNAQSTNLTLIPEEAMLFSGTGTNRFLSITPALDQAGISRITVLVSDSRNTVSNSFMITVSPRAGLVFTEEFNYPDGPLVSGSALLWNTHSGSNDQMRVTGGRILVTSTNTEDVSAFLGTSSFPAGGGWILYSSFTAEFKRLPTSADYFAHFKSTGSSAFGARVFVTTNGAASGRLRLGIANSGGFPSAVFPLDLPTDVIHTVVTRYNVGTGQSRLWVNPAAESSPSVTATDNAFPFEVFTYAFRESSGIGDILVDSLKVGTAFTDVMVSRPSLTIARVGSSITVSWPASASGYVLRFASSLPALWADSADQGTVVGDNKVVTIPNASGIRFFELRQP